MKLKIIMAYFLAISPLAQAQNVPSSAPAAKGTGLTLEQYLDQVRTRNSEARSLVDNVAALELRLRESELVLVPELYADLGMRDDKMERSQPQFMGDHTRGSEWTVGVRKQTSFGLGADVFFKERRTNIHGLPANFESDYQDNWATLRLTQSLWRNGFGEGVRAQIAAAKSAAEIQLLQTRFQLKNLMLEAENTYWSLASYNDIMELQQGNVDRGRKLYDWMAKRTRLRLYDDVDSMQARAALEMRELELQTSMDERNVLIRRFNTLRGLNSDQVEGLEDLPSQSKVMQAAQKSSKNFTREDFEIMRAQAKAILAQATVSASAARPKVDLVGEYSTTGHDVDRSRARDEVNTDRFPVWQVGVSVAVPLDFGITRDVRRGLSKARNASESLEQQAQFAELRAWDDFNRQKNEAINRYQRSVSLEKLQTQLVKSERQRLLNGRTTTFQLSTFESNLSGAQIQRIRSQLAVIQLHNILQQFQERQ